MACVGGMAPKGFRFPFFFPFAGQYRKRPLGPLVALSQPNMLISWAPTNPSIHHPPNRRPPLDILSRQWYCRRGSAFILILNSLCEHPREEEEAKKKRTPSAWIDFNRPLGCRVHTYIHVHIAAASPRQLFPRPPSVFSLM